MAQFSQNDIWKFIVNDTPWLPFSIVVFVVETVSFIQTNIHDDTKNDLEILKFNPPVSNSSVLRLKYAVLCQIYWSRDQIWMIGKIIPTDSYTANLFLPLAVFFTTAHWRASLYFIFYCLLVGTFGGLFIGQFILMD